MMPKGYCGPSGQNCYPYTLTADYTVKTDSSGLDHDIKLLVNLKMLVSLKTSDDFGFVVNTAYNSNNEACESFIVQKKKQKTGIFDSKKQEVTYESYFSKKPLMLVREDPTMGYKKEVDKLAPWKFESFKVFNRNYEIQFMMSRKFR